MTDSSIKSLVGINITEVSEEPKQKTTRCCTRGDNNAKVGPANHQNGQRTIFLNYDESANKKSKFVTNYISTTQYTLWNFLPLSLFNQFRRIANFYFLIIAILQSIPAISPLNPVTAIAPLIFVVGVSMLRDGYEDYKRYKADKETNDQTVKALRKGQFVEIKSSEIEVGDILLINESETFPADLILLSSGNEDGTAFIQTSSLDGEKNLKKRLVPKNLDKKFQQGNKDVDQLIFTGICESSAPSEDLYTYVGKLTINDIVYPLDVNQLFLKGASLQNTVWCVAFCVFTGKDTRLMMNAQDGKIKLSALEKKLNLFVIGVLVAQMVLCIALSIMSTWWDLDSSLKVKAYIPEEFKQSVQGVLNFFTYFLLLNTMLPISLFVSLEIIKASQSVWLAWDVLLYCQERDRPAKVSNSTLIEELGQVHYLFSDKTGTLTRNEMQMRAITVGNTTYDTITDANGEQKFEFQKFNDSIENEEKISQITIQSKGGKSKLVFNTQKQRLTEFMKVLSCAHECVREKSKTKDAYFYMGPSPDEVQLVEFSKEMGFVFLSENQQIIKYTVKSSQEPLKLELLKKIEFNSDRKRMSILVRDPADGLIKLYIKGADSIILDRLSREPQKNDEGTMTYVKKFVDYSSCIGLRTLLVAVKVLDEDELQQFNQDVEKADSNIENRDANMAKVFDLFERDLTLIGATAVEDRLQDKVPETIYDLQQAGIKIWMLTGDKFETAENIGMSCRLISADFHVYKMRNANDVELVCDEDTIAINKSLMEQGKKRGMIVEATALGKILSSQQAQQKFVQLAKTCDAVICCRVSPGQKAQVVALIKNEDSQIITAAIGDGANDVSMIREAHIGIGLYGNEGMRAVQSADFALGEFRYLWRLFLVHGRLAYQNNAEMIPYFFYKNLVMTLPVLFYAFYTGFSGLTLYEDFYISFYNMCFTCLPLLFRAMLDFDISSTKDGEIMLKFIPSLYYSGQMSLSCNDRVFTQWFFLGIFHSAIVFFIPLYTIESAHTTKIRGYTDDLWLLSLSSFTAVIYVVTGKLFTVSRSFTIWNLLAFSVTSIGFYVAYMWASNYIGDKMDDAVLQAHTSPLYYLSVLLCVGICFSFDYFVQSFNMLAKPNPSEFLRRLIQRPKDLENEKIQEKFFEIVQHWKSKQTEKTLVRDVYLDQKRQELKKLINQQQ